MSAKENTRKERRETLLDRRFNQLLAAVKAAKGKPIAIFGRSIESPVGSGLDDLLTICLQGKVYSLVDCLESKCRLAVDGWLGSDLVEMGKRVLPAIEKRLARERHFSMKDSMREMWGPWFKSAWELNAGGTHDAGIAAAVRRILEGGKTPAPKTRLPASQWALAKRLAARLTATKKA